MKLTFKKYAFTLAEIILTLMLIGIVAVMTIPGLMNNISDKETHTAFAKDFAILSQAMNLMLPDLGGTLKGANIAKDSAVLKDYFKTHLSYTKDCNSFCANNGCWHKSSKIKSLNQTGIPFWPNLPEIEQFPGLVLADGALVVIRPDVIACTGSGWSGTQDCGQMYIDVNGFKAPNTIGKDIFGVWIKENKLMPIGISDSFASDCSTAISSSGWGCGYKVLNNIDY